MMEVSSSVKMEEDENELSLELSIGRKCYKKTTPLPQKSIDFTTQQESICRSSSKMIISPRSQLDSAVELPLKREILALRRQEARKKREEKIMRFKSTSSCIGGGGGKNGNVCCVINQEDNAVDDEDDEAEMPPRKKERSQSSCHDNNVVVGQKEQEQQEELVVRDLNLKMDDHASSFKVQSSYSSLPAMQYVPFTNGIVYHPHGVIPSCLGSLVACTNGLLMEKDKRVSFGNIVGGNEGPEKDKRVSFDTEACRSFRPYSRRNVDIIKSDGSSGPSSSAVSDHHKSSLQGGSSSINFPQESQNTSSAGNGPKKSEIKCWDSMGMGSNEVNVRTKANPTVNMASSTHIQAIESMCSEEPKPAAPPKEPILSAKNPIHPALSNKETSNGVITNNPLKSQPGCNGALPLPQMPCVSTTGNGPDGKTITGFLYRYTKTEVFIVCVCHGTSFSPAEFVNHAGGVDVEHPLRHITIVPSDLA